MISTCKLTYFNLKGRAEVSRMIFAYVGLKYEDCRVTAEEWTAMKPSTPYGQLPLLDIDGVRLFQSDAINRYIAKQYGLAGANPLEEAQVDQIMGCTGDIVNRVVETLRAKDKAARGILTEEFNRQHLPHFLTKLQQLLISNDGGDGFFVGKSLTLADIAVAQVFDWPQLMRAEPVDFDKYPKIGQLKARVEQIPEIAEWLRTRPTSR